MKQVFKRNHKRRIDAITGLVLIGFGVYAINIDYTDVKGYVLLFIGVFYILDYVYPLLFPYITINNDTLKVHSFGNNTSIKLSSNISIEKVYPTIKIKNNTDEVSIDILKMNASDRATFYEFLDRF